MNGRLGLAVVLGALASGAAPLRIVTTTSDLAAIASAVAGGGAETHSLCSGREDPHVLQARPGMILRARDADLWIRVGLELEIGWEPAVLDGARNARIRPGARGHLDLSEVALILDVPEGPVTRAMGDVHPMGNPHYWLDPLNGRRMAAAIAERIAELRPDLADAVRANAAAFQRALDERMFGPRMVEAVGGDALWSRALDGTLDAFLDEPSQRDKLGGWVAAMRPWRGAAIVTYHRSWIYFARRFGISVIGELEPKPGVPPTAAHLAALEKRARAAGVRIVLQEPFYSPKAARRLAERIGGRVVTVAGSVGGEREATDYLALLDLIVRRITEGA